MRGQKGITLVALVITIIVMLILVGVSVTVAINGGLFDKAKEGATGTQEAANAERNLSNGKVMIDGNEHNVTDFALKSKSIISCEFAGHMHYMYMPKNLLREDKRRNNIGSHNIYNNFYNRNIIWKLFYTCNI